MSDVDRVTAALDEIRETLRLSRAPIAATRASLWWIRNTKLYDAQVPRLLAALDAVLALHPQAVLDIYTEPFRYCARCTGHPAWPCPEVEAITAALLGKDAAT